MLTLAKGPAKWKSSKIKNFHTATTVVQPRYPRKCCGLTTIHSRKDKVGSLDFHPCKIVIRGPTTTTRSRMLCREPRLLLSPGNNKLSLTLHQWVPGAESELAPPPGRSKISPSSSFGWYQSRPSGDSEISSYPLITRQPHNCVSRDHLGRFNSHPNPELKRSPNPNLSVSGGQMENLDVYLYLPEWSSTLIPLPEQRQKRWNLT